MKKFLTVIFTLALLSGCSDDNKSNAVHIRLANASAYDFEQITVNTTTGDVMYGDLKSGQLSDYKSFEVAYSYAFVELMIDGEVYTLQPIDYFGETPLEDGKYTYRIDANDSQERFGKLSLTLIAE